MTSIKKKTGGLSMANIADAEQAVFNLASIPEKCPYIAEATKRGGDKHFTVILSNKQLQMLLVLLKVQLTLELLFL